MRRRSFLVLAGACSVCSCAGAVHRLPQVTGDSVAMARSEVQSAGAPRRHAVTDEEGIAMLRSAVRRIRPSASEVCREMNVGVCTWTFRASSDRSMNAASGANGLIIVNRGIVEYAANEEEMAMVIAHEIGHQSANHVATAQRNQAVGALIGALLGTAVMASGGYGGADAMQTGADVGAAVGRISYSKEQEREADYLAALILYRSGVDLDRARGFLVTMARASGRRETGMLDTHPAGPERIAGWDRAVAEIRASHGRLPQRA
ncbi:M48 family metallopeptidase [Reyranella sp.]|uniref:M48 family metallopeptidase n=1 Tax=Reyranella sp. TaxID=1929291 RepID=UPI003D0E5960